MQLLDFDGVQGATNVQRSGSVMIYYLDGRQVVTKEKLVTCVRKVPAAKLLIDIGIEVERNRDRMSVSPFSLRVPARKILSLALAVAALPDDVSGLMRIAAETFVASLGGNTLTRERPGSSQGCGDLFHNALISSTRTGISLSP